MMLQQILQPAARERCKQFFFFIIFILNILLVSRIRLVKPEKARGVEDLLIRAAQSGQVFSHHIVSFQLMLCIDLS